MSVNWGKLHAEGRCREVGVSWTEKEAVEILVEKSATVEEVRARYYPEKIEAMQKIVDENTIVDEEAGEVEIEVEEVESKGEWGVASSVEPVEDTITAPDTVVGSVGENSDLDNLKQQATDLGIQFNPNIGFEKLQKRINENNGVS